MRLLDDALLDVINGIRLKTSPRLIVEMPPRHGKSELVSKYLPAWALRYWPDWRVILTSYEADFAASWGRKARTLLTTHGGDVQVARDSKAADHWDIDGHTGGMVTAGIRGPITGKGADLLIIDDPVKNDEEARSQTIRERNWEWYTSTARTRLEPGGAVVVIMTRWHEDDLVGRMLADMEAGGDSWRVIRLPAIAEANDPMGREFGDALWPERYDATALDLIRKGMSSYYWQALYQQAPTIRGGSVIKDEWWRTYSNAAQGRDILTGARYTIHAWDTAFKTGQSNDYSVCTIWAETGMGAYLMNMYRGRVEFPDLVRVSKHLIDRFPASAVIIEDKASGQSLAQELQRHTRTPIIPVPVDSDKVARAYSVTPEIEGARTFIPSDLPETALILPNNEGIMTNYGTLGIGKTFRGETAAFPNGSHDDIVDSTVLGLSYIIGKRNAISRVVARPSAQYRSPYAQH